MSGFFDRLVARARGEASSLQPLYAPLFAPAPEPPLQPESALVEGAHVERDAPLSAPSARVTEPTREPMREDRETHASPATRAPEPVTTPKLMGQSARSISSPHAQTIEPIREMEALPSRARVPAELLNEPPIAPYDDPIAPPPQLMPPSRAPDAEAFSQPLPPRRPSERDAAMTPAAPRMTRSQRQSPAQISEPPSVHVSIGRIDVHATTPPAPTPRRAAAERRAAMSLEQYLAERDRGGR